MPCYYFIFVYMKTIMYIAQKFIIGGATTLKRHGPLQPCINESVVLWQEILMFRGNLRWL